MTPQSPLCVSTEKISLLAYRYVDKDFTDRIYALGEECDESAKGVLQSVGQAKNHALKEHSKYTAAAPRIEFPDEISMKGELFSKARRHGEC